MVQRFVLVGHCLRRESSRVKEGAFDQSGIDMGKISGVDTKQLVDVGTGVE